MDPLVQDSVRTIAALNIGMAVLCIAAAYPLLVGMVPRNQVFGFKTRRSLASDEAWYRANRLAARCMIVGALAIGALNALFLLLGLPGPTAVVEQLVIYSAPVGLVAAGLCAWVLHQRP
jgi:uncharacterized membrane protein